MERHKTVFRIVLEVAQWFFIILCIGVLCMFCFNFYKFKTYPHDKAKVYQKISDDRKIESLTRRNRELSDSLANVQKDTVTVVKYKTKTIYIPQPDTVSKESVTHD